MAKDDLREDDEQPEVPASDPGSKPDRFPDKALVRAFAEDLLRKGQQGSYQPVESQRRPAGAALRRPAAWDPADPAPEAGAELDPRHTPPGPPALLRPRAAAADPRRAAQGATLQAHNPRAEHDSADDPIDGVHECLSDDSILAFVQGTLTGAELVRTHRHLDICPQCQRLIVEAVHAISVGRREAATSDPQGSALRPGAVLANRYRIQRFVARGGMGEVYEAYDRTLRERVALKTVMPTVSDSPRAVRRLMAEVQLARRVSHPNVCRIYDLGAEQLSDGDRALHFLTMEFVEGLSLAQELERGGPMKVEVAVDIARQLLSGLDAAHEAGILHRDFKPDNIMLRPTNGARQRAVIMDFGLARAMDVDPARLTTGANQPLIGTLTYMAPEQVEGGDLTAGTDIFAFGIVFFEMLTGCVPFVGGSPAATALKRLKEAPPGPVEYAPAVPKHINRIVLKCLARHPNKRYASAAEVLAALEDEPSSLASSDDRPHRWRQALPVVGVVGALLLLFWAVMPARTEPPAQAESPSVQADSPKTKAEPSSVVVRVDTAQQEATAQQGQTSNPAKPADVARASSVQPLRNDLSRADGKTPVARKTAGEPPMPPAPSATAPALVESPHTQPKDELMVPSIFGEPPGAAPAPSSTPPALPQETGSRRSSP